MATRMATRMATCIATRIAPLFATLLVETLPCLPYLLRLGHELKRNENDNKALKQLE